MLLQAAWLAPRSKPLPVYLPEELIQPLRNWLEAVFLPDSLLGFTPEFRPWQEGRTENVATGVRVTPFATTHLESLKQMIDPSAHERFKVYGLAVECSGRRIVFSSDLGAPSDLAPALSVPCDVLVCELSHFSPAELFAFLRGKEIGQLVLTHLSGALAGQEAEIAVAAREALPQIRDIEVARDGEVAKF